MTNSVMKTSQHTRASISTFHGVEFFPLAPRYEDIYVEDIAHALSQLCRYNGHTQQFYSVGQHCVLVSEWLEYYDHHCDKSFPEEVVKWGLVHDATETYIPDVCAPIKPFLQGFSLIEDQLSVAIAQRFGLEWPMPDVVRYADKAMFRSEVSSGIMRPVDWWQFHPEHPDAGMKIVPVSSVTAEKMFIDRFVEVFGWDVFNQTRKP